MKRKARKYFGLCLMRDAIVEVCEEKNVEDFLWKEM
jgi:hypothetical protein